MNSILITGCNRGLGLGIVKALIRLPKPPQHLFATCRNKDKAEELNSLAAANRNLHILEIDLRNFNEYDNLVKQISETTNNNGLNVLFNNAGVAPKSSRINATREKDLVETLYTNTVVPILLTKACFPLLKKAAEINTNNDTLSIQRAAIINMSSIYGSVKANVEGGLYPYRASKAGLNAATKSMSIDFKQNHILCVSLHPGWVRTDMGGTKAPLDVDTASESIVKTMFKFNETHNGGFYQYDGKELPW